MADNLRPMLYGAGYEGGDRRPRRRLARGDACRDALRVGRYARSREARLEDARVGESWSSPATGGYGHAMASNYNGVPRPPVIFCREGDARAVVRRESYEDLTARAD